MKRVAKILLFVVILLLGILDIKIGYYLLYKPGITTLPRDNVAKNDLLNLISKVQKPWENTLDGLGFLKSRAISKRCGLGSNCVELENKSNRWRTYSSDKPILIDSPFVVRLSMQNKNDLSGIQLYGKLPPTSVWWKDITSILIGTRNNGKTLHVDLRDGSSETAIHLVNRELDKRIGLIYIFFDRSGKNVLITDEEYKPIEYLNINKLTGNKFPSGLFPENKFFVGYTIGPFSYLAILDFTILLIKI